MQLNIAGARLSRAVPGKGAALHCLFLFLADLLAGTLTSQRGLDTLLFTGLKVKGVALNLLDDVFGLHLTLETAQSILKGLAFLHTNLCHLDTPPNLPAGEVLGYDTRGRFQQNYSLRATMIRVSSKCERARFHWLIESIRVRNPLHSVGAEIAHAAGTRSW